MAPFIRCLALVVVALASNSAPATESEDGQDRAWRELVDRIVASMTDVNGQEHRRLTYFVSDPSGWTKEERLTITADENPRIEYRALQSSAAMITPLGLDPKLTAPADIIARNSRVWVQTDGSRCPGAMQALADLEAVYPQQLEADHAAGQRIWTDSASSEGFLFGTLHIDYTASPAGAANLMHQQAELLKKRILECTR